MVPFNSYNYAVLRRLYIVKKTKVSIFIIPFFVSVEFILLNFRFNNCKSIKKVHYFISHEKF